MVDEYEEDLSPEEMAYLQTQAQQEAIYDYPHPEEKASVFSIFKKIIKTRDTSKVGNLDKFELLSVRAAQHLSLFVETQGYDIVSDYFKKKAEVILATSLSKDAAFIQAVITQKRQLLSDKKKTWEGKKWKKKTEGG